MFTHEFDCYMTEQGTGVLIKRYLKMRYIHFIALKKSLCNMKWVRECVRIQWLSRFEIFLAFKMLSRYEMPLFICKCS